MPLRIKILEIQKFYNVRPKKYFKGVAKLFTKAIYIRLGDWSFLNGDKTKFVEVFKH